MGHHFVPTCCTQLVAGHCLIWIWAHARQWATDLQIHRSILPSCRLAVDMIKVFTVLMGMKGPSAVTTSGCDVKGQRGGGRGGGLTCRFGDVKKPPSMVLMLSSSEA